MFGRIGVIELVLFLAIALLIFGPKKIPLIGKAIGSAIRNIKRQVREPADELGAAETESDSDRSSSAAGSEHEPR